MTIVIAVLRPRRLRISLRVLMLVVLLVGGWMGWQVNKARKQREAVAAVKKYGGWVHYDWEMVNGKVTKGTQPAAPRWLRQLLGDEYFQEIAEVSLVYDDSTGKRFDIRNLEPADNVLSRLGGMTSLKTVLLMKTQATDQGLKHLGRARNLEKLFIWDAAEVSDAGIAHLVALKGLTFILISNSKMTDVGLARLATLPKLEVMNLQGNRFTDAGLASLRGSRNLRRLCVGLGATRITDDGLDHLKNLENLQLLDLQRTGVTDRGLERLKGLTKLREVWLSQTATTDEGKESFKEAMPNLKVIR